MTSQLFSEYNYSRAICHPWLTSANREMPFVLTKAYARSYCLVFCRGSEAKYGKKGSTSLPKGMPNAKGDFRMKRRTINSRNDHDEVHVFVNAVLFRACWIEGVRYNAQFRRRRTNTSCRQKGEQSAVTTDVDCILEADCARVVRALVTEHPNIGLVQSGSHLRTMPVCVICTPSLRHFGFQEVRMVHKCQDPKIASHIERSNRQNPLQSLVVMICLQVQVLKGREFLIGAKRWQRFLAQVLSCSCSAICARRGGKRTICATDDEEASTVFLYDFSKSPGTYLLWRIYPSGILADLAGPSAPVVQQESLGSADICKDSFICTKICGKNSSAVRPQLDFEYIPKILNKLYSCMTGDRRPESLKSYWELPISAAGLRTGPSIALLSLYQPAVTPRRRFHQAMAPRGSKITSHESQSKEDDNARHEIRQITLL
ncbi:unnamed protein product [Nesidiocoris tenuis]|uniref:Uncharacterized protein n=1 Tax=Nesidiocoris tenuis TaxID=355587 RepID=A0A6H5GBI9_9HEMI|nr:unnamed protein product [Nesidiocoris tenuis]